MMRANLCTIVEEVSSKFEKKSITLKDVHIVMPVNMEKLSTDGTTCCM